MLRKLRTMLRKRSGQKTLTPKRVAESPEQKVQRLVQQRELENFWNYTGDEQPEIDPAALLENSQ